MTFKELESQYKKRQLAWKTHIRMKPTKWKRFWGWCGYACAFPFVWAWVNIRDWHTFVIFVTVFIVMSSEIWIPYLIAIVCWNDEPLRNTLIGVASSCFVFWAMPMTPFLLICVFLTMAIKGLFNKIKYGKKNENISNNM